MSAAAGRLSARELRWHRAGNGWACEPVRGRSRSYSAIAEPDGSRWSLSVDGFGTSRHATLGDAKNAATCDLLGGPLA